jgi:hypothetical protein
MGTASAAKAKSPGRVKVITETDAECYKDSDIDVPQFEIGGDGNP